MNIIIPANNEAAHIGACLEALLASKTNIALWVIVVANGCNDDTVSVAKHYALRADARGWRLRVVEISKGHKPSALNAGDAHTQPGPRAYLDADVLVSPDLIQQISDILSCETAIYTSGIVQIPHPESFISRAYARIYAQVPFMIMGVPGCGLYAVNPAGRRRWGAFPDIIADDTFVRLNFAPGERIGVAASYQWPVVEGARALLRVRRRQNAGVQEFNRLYPALVANDDKPGFGKKRALRLALTDPFGFLTYAVIGLLARRTKFGTKSGANSGASQDWSRGR